MTSRVAPSSISANIHCGFCFFDLTINDMNFVWTGFCVCVALISSMAHAETKNVEWHTVGSFKEPALRVYGLPWYWQNAGFGRLPTRLREKIQKENPDAWEESLCPSGARVRFKTNSSSLRVRILHGNDRISLYHMASSATAGMDLYEAVKGVSTYRGTSKPVTGTEPYEHIYYLDYSSQYREFTLYLPTYARLESLQIGVTPGSVIEEAKEYRYSRPIVFYGTSITQSCCPSRGSSGYVPLLGRMLDSEVVNLGFSGAGKGEEFMAELVASVDASVYVIDSVANMGGEIQGRSLMDLNYKKFIQAIRSRRPRTPIVLMTKPRYAEVRAPWGEQISETDQSYRALHEPLYDVYKELKSKGDTRVWVFDAAEALPKSADPLSVDGIHPDSRGFLQLAKRLEPLLKKTLFLIRNEKKKSAPQPFRRIALTFDDAPQLSGGLYTGVERTQRLIRAMDEGGVKEAVFYANSHNLGNDQGRERIKAYAEAGHLIGNHTHSHLNLNEVGKDRFVADFVKAHELIAGLPGFYPSFRYPHSMEGKTEQVQAEVRREIIEKGYEFGYFTAESADWLMEQMLQDALRAGKKVNWDRLKDVYLKINLESLEFFDELARKTMGRSPAHVYLLHENDLNARFLPDLIAAFKKEGWNWIPSREAFDDPISKRVPHQLMTQFRVSGIAIGTAGYSGPIEPAIKMDAEMYEQFKVNKVFE